jgi:hypothetical protein
MTSRSAEGDPRHFRSYLKRISGRWEKIQPSRTIERMKRGTTLMEMIGLRKKNS